MTYCSTLAKPLLRKIKAGETIDTLSKTLCGKNIKRPRQKIIRIIREVLGEDYLQDNAEKLGYHPEKAVRKKENNSENVNGKILSKSLDSKNKNDTNKPVKELTFDDAVDAVRELVSIFSLQEIKKAIAEIEKE